MAASKPKSNSKPVPLGGATKSKNSPKNVPANRRPNPKEWKQEPKPKPSATTKSKSGFPSGGRAGNASTTNSGKDAWDFKKPGSAGRMVGVLNSPALSAYALGAVKRVTDAAKAAAGARTPGTPRGKEAAYAAAAAKASAAAKNKARAQSKPVPLGGVKKPAVKKPSSYNDSLNKGATSIKGFAYGKKTQ
jgi:hypothetical protein